MRREKSYNNEFLGCCLTYIQDLHDMIDCMDEELQKTKTDLQEAEHKADFYKEEYENVSSHNINLKSASDSINSRLKSANTLVDHQADIIREVRQLIIDNIVITADTDGNEEMNIIAYKPDVNKIFELLEITDEDYCE